MNDGSSTDQSSIFGYLGREAGVGQDIPSGYRAYLASALTSRDEEAFRRLERIREEVERACNTYDVFLYAPMDETHPEEHGELPASEVFERDRRAVAISDLLLLVADCPSFGAGQELEIARNAHVPIIALVPEEKDLSRMVYGAPTFKQVIEYGSVDEIAPPLEQELGRLYPLFDETRKARAKAQQEMVGDHIRQHRQEEGLTRKELADRVGVVEEEVRRIEQEPVEVSNASLITLCRIAHVLDLSPSTLMNPATQAGYGELLMDHAADVEERLVGARQRSSIPPGDYQILKGRVAQAFHRMASE